MAICVQPKVAWRTLLKSGARPMFSLPALHRRLKGEFERMLLPCQRCRGCRINYAWMWSVRNQLEASLWDYNMFVTLTYDDQHLPAYGSIVRKDFTDFLKRLRFELKGQQQHGVDAKGKAVFPIRYFGCGEYGTDKGRPHYHLCLYNVRLWDAVRRGRKYQTSETLSRLWPFGFHTIAPLTPRACSYASQYAAKKLYGAHAMELYSTGAVDDDGCSIEREPEFCAMSLKPGIGKWWFDRYRGDLRGGFIVIDGRQVMIPQYFLAKLKEGFPEEHEEILYRRQKYREAHAVSYDEEVRRQDAQKILLEQKHLAAIQRRAMKSMLRGA